jgi:hypothetical protein
MRLLLASSLALAAFLAGCDRSGSPATQPLSALANGSTPQFLGQIADAPFQNAYYSRRRVWQSFQAASGPAELEYTEGVWSDGQGHFSVTPESVQQPALSSQDEQAFVLMQKVREGFVYRVRDFRIQDLGSFLLSYTIEDLNQSVSVAGQACERLRIRPAGQGPVYWELDVDPTTGLILATREFQQDGRLVSLVETLEYKSPPDLSGVVLHQDLATLPFTPATAQQVLGFTPLQPNFLPQGFALAKSEKIEPGGQTWARCTYTNGGESLFLLYRRDSLGSTQTADPAGPYTIRIFSAGRWTVAQASLGRHRIIVMGREPAAILQQVVESCAP